MALLRSKYQKVTKEATNSFFRVFFVFREQLRIYS